MTESEQEARAERTAIMTCEGVPPEEIEKVLAAYPWIFGIEEKTEVQDSIFAPATTQAL